MKILIKVTKDVLKRSAMCGLISPTVNTFNSNPLQQLKSNCAIALAISELFPKAHVDMGRIWFFGDSESKSRNNDTSDTSRLPDKAQDFILEFDSFNNPLSREMMDEIEFEIQVPNSVIDVIGIEEAKAVLSESKTLQFI